MESSQHLAMRQVDWRFEKCRVCQSDSINPAVFGEMKVAGSECIRCFAIVQAARSLLEESGSILPGQSVDEMTLRCTRRGIVQFGPGSKCFLPFYGLENQDQDQDQDEDEDKYYEGCSMNLYYVNPPGDKEAFGKLEGSEISRGAYRWGEIEPKYHLAPEDNGLNFASKMWNRCRQTNHCQPSGAKFIPTRLINVESSDNLQGKVRLCVGEALNPYDNTEYAALSYCWGADKADSSTMTKTYLLKMTKKTLHDMKEGISFHALPRVFQDAVITTRRLGLRYLWIDALCIAQGDREDWEAESVKMDPTYSNASVTIIAAASDSVNHSFLDVSEFRKWRKGIEIKAPEGQEFRPKAFVRWTYTTLYGEGQITGIPDRVSKMDKRAWTLQEALLSRRVLIFERTRVVFACLEGRFCEDGDNPISFLAYWRNSPDYDWWRPVQTRDQLTPLEVDEIWRHVVYECSRRDLTNYDNRLPGIAGIASKLQSKLEPASKSRYLAGLWQHSFVKQLAWWTPADKEIGKERLAAPSWSWASVRSAAWPIGNEHGVFFETGLRGYSLDCDAESARGFGGARSGQADLEGPYLETNVTERKPRLKEYILNPQESALRPFERETHFHADFAWKVNPACSASDRDEPDSTIYGEELQTWLQESNVFLLRLASSQTPEWVQAWYLVLKRVKERDDLYQRIGLWNPCLWCLDEEALKSAQDQYEETQGAWPKRIFKVI